MVTKILKRRTSIPFIPAPRPSNSLSLRRHLTDDDRIVGKYQRHQATTKAILTGNFVQIDDRDLDDLMRSWAERGGTTQIPELVYDDMRFTTDDAKKLAKILRANTPANIRVLRMTRNALRGGVARILLKALAGNRTIREIILARNGFDDKDCKYVARLLHANPCLVSIDLSGNFIGPDGALLIADALKQNERLESIYLQGNRFHASGTLAFAEMLSVNRSLRHLDLGFNKLQSAGATFLSRALQSNRGLHTISLDLNEIGFEGSLMLADVLRVNKHLTHVHIPRNNIGDKGVVWLCSALLDNRQVRMLDLGGNNIGLSRDNTGAEAIARLLRSNSTLRDLNLDTNLIGDDGAKHIAAALRDNTTLERLVLSSCSIGLEGIRAFADALPHNSRLQYVSLAENLQFGPDGHWLLADALRNNKVLKILQLDFKHDGWEYSYKSIEHSLTRNYIVQRGRYVAACNILCAARIILGGYPFRPRPCSGSYSARNVTANNLATLPFEILECILLATDTAGVLTSSEVLHIARFATRRETLARNLTRAAFLEITLGAYFASEEGEAKSRSSNTSVGWALGVRVRFA